MNSNTLEMLQNYILNDNDKEDDKMKEKEITAQLNINIQNQDLIKNNTENENEDIHNLINHNINEENQNFHNFDINNNIDYSNNYNNINDEENINSNEEISINDNNRLSNNEMKSIFENPILQTSYNLFTKLRRIIIRKENLMKINYFDKWQKNIKNIPNNISNNINNLNNLSNLQNDENNIMNNKNSMINIGLNNTVDEENNNLESNTSASIQNRNVIQNILMSKEELEHPDISPNQSHNDVILQHQNQLLNSGNKNFQNLINPFASINDMNFESDYSYLNNNVNNKINNHMNINIENNDDNENENDNENDNYNLDNNKSNENMIVNNFVNLPREKKLLCLSLVNIFSDKLYYHFKHITQALKFRIIINNYHDKLFQMDRLNKKYESILDEKSSIIINKTDEIEDLKEKLDSLSKSLKEALKKQKTLNVIPESLCSKCGGSLEESFTSEALTENQKIIKEQNDVIERMKKEMNELRTKYNYSELRLKDLDEIKKEFENLSGVLLRPKIENSTQTESEPQSQALSSSFLSSSTTNNSNLNNSNSKTMRNKAMNVKNMSNKSQFGNSKTKFNNNTKKKGGNIPQQQKKVTNYNIININNNNNNTSIMSNTNNFMNSTNSNTNNGINEGYSTMKFDNSILSAELLNLNKEFNKLKNENKLICEKNNKFDKEKKEILDKLKNKTEMCEKYKKENAELIILINNSRYKNMIETENENKKLKMTLEQIDNEIKNMNVINEKNEQKIKEQNMQLEKMKSIINTYNSFKAQKDNLLLANTKYESEIKRLKYDLEQERDINEKNKIILKNNEIQIDKLNKEVGFYSSHINQYKADAAKALEDAVEYQQIVTALQATVNEYKVALNKIKQNKKI